MTCSIVWPLSSAGALQPELDGIGSSYAAHAVEDWTFATIPSGLNLTYTSTSSDDGRGEFESYPSSGYDWATTDVPYGVDTQDSGPVVFPFDYVPIAGDGIELQYNIPGLTKTLQLSSAATCGLLTGAITNWDNPVIAADNPGVVLPNLAVVPVTESDNAATSFTLESYCISQQPALWAAFANQLDTQPGGPPGSVPLSATTPYAAWPAITGGVSVTDTYDVHEGVGSTSGAIGAIQGSTEGQPGVPVASLLNASGEYTRPTEANITSALAYATETAGQPVQLDFGAQGPNVYSLSTVSYLLLTTTASAAYGAEMSAFVNFGMTTGQQVDLAFGYPTLGQTLEQFSLSEMEVLDGSVPETADELAAFPCGDLTPSEVAAGLTAPTCSNPGTGTPEAPYALALPLMGIAAFGGVVWVRRRRALRGP